MACLVIVNGSLEFAVRTSVPDIDHYSKRIRSAFALAYEGFNGYIVNAMRTGQGGVPLSPCLQLTERVFTCKSGPLLSGTDILDRSSPMMSSWISRIHGPVYLCGLGLETDIRELGLELVKSKEVILLADACAPYNKKPDDGTDAVLDLEDAGVCVQTVSEVYAAYL